MKYIRIYIGQAQVSDTAGHKPTKNPIIVNPTESDTFVTGREVDIEGSPKDVVRVIDKAAIIKVVPMVMNHKYGTLEKVI